MSYTLTATTDLPPDEAERRVREALADEGFGILTEIDVRSTLQDKLGEDVGPYKILGACNPPLARAAIAADAHIGAVLPCNVVVRVDEAGHTEIAALDPATMLGVSDADGLDALADEARGRIERALRAVVA